MSDHPLDADTALEPVTPTRWRGAISDRWWVVRGPFGGYVATFLTRALVAAVDDPARRPRSLTVHFVEAPEAGPVEVSAHVERAGRSSTSVSLRLEQDGRPVALALGSSATWRDGEPEWTETAAGRAAARGLRAARAPRPDAGLPRPASRSAPSARSSAASRATSPGCGSTRRACSTTSR